MGEKRHNLYFSMQVFLCKLLKSKKYFVKVVRRHMDWESCQVLGLGTGWCPEADDLAGQRVKGAAVISCHSECLREQFHYRKKPFGNKLLIQIYNSANRARKPSGPS